MNTYIWRRAPAHDNPATWAFQHAGKLAHIDRRLISTTPPPRMVTDAQMADLHAAAKTLRRHEQGY